MSSSYLHDDDSEEERVDSIHYSVEEIAKITETVMKLKAEGNDFFANGNFDEAISKYSEAIDTLKRLKVSKDPIILLNRCAAFLSVKRYVPALNDANQGLEIVCTVPL